MNTLILSGKWNRPVNQCLFFLGFLLLSLSCNKIAINKNDLRDFKQVNLVANSAAYSPLLVDPTLHNAWGLAWAPSGIAWVNSMSGHVSDLYTADGAIVRPPVNIPSPMNPTGGFPTGIVFAGGAGFTLANNQPPNFLFVGIDGVLSGWNGADGNNAQRIADSSATSAYTGLALTTWNGSHLLYAANFRAGRIDVWDTSFRPVPITFSDPFLPRGFSPFNIQAVGSWLFVLYAKVGSDGRDQAGAGLGFVDIFNPDGSFVRRFASGGSLNAPWGVVMTPENFLEDNDNNESHGGNDDKNGSGNNGNNGMNDHNDNDDHDPGSVILIGNFGDGRINVFSIEGQFLGQLQSHNHTIVIDKLWALSFAPVTATAVDPLRLYFTAGPNNENDGLFGYLIRD